MLHYRKARQRRNSLLLWLVWLALWGAIGWPLIWGLVR